MPAASDVDELAPLLRRRLGLTDDLARAMATQYLQAVTIQAIQNVRSGVAPTSIASWRLQLIESVAAQFGRLPSAREISALLRVPESSARTILRNVLAMSDGVQDVALRSVFDRAKVDGRLGREGEVPNGVRWVMGSLGDLQTARDLLERRGARFATLKEDDGEYVLAVEPSFDPVSL